jgi:hypothetical protein
VAAGVDPEPLARADDSAGSCAAAGRAEGAEGAEAGSAGPEVVALADVPPAGVMTACSAATGAAGRASGDSEVPHAGRRAVTRRVVPIPIFILPVRLR